MLETIQWIVLLLLGGCVGWLWRDRTAHRVPPWVSELEEEDLVLQSDLDQYHHRVVQLSHTQKDLLLKKIQALETRQGEGERVVADSSEPLSHAPAQPATPLEGGDPLKRVEPRDSTPSSEQPSDRENKPEPFDSEDEKASSPEREEPPADPDPTFVREEASNPTTRILRLWSEGKPTDEIARDLRMGRQEVQLLIEMSRHSTSGVPRG